jgi:hypothetical protein
MKPRIGQHRFELLGVLLEQWLEPHALTVQHRRLRPAIESHHGLTICGRHRLVAERSGTSAAEARMGWMRR